MKTADTRFYTDCREVPSIVGCTVAMSADSEEELMEAAVQHAIAVHQEHDTQELRDMVRKGIHPGEAPTP